MERKKKKNPAPGRIKNHYLQIGRPVLQSLGYNPYLNAHNLLQPYFRVRHHPG